MTLSINHDGCKISKIRLPPDSEAKRDDPFICFAAYMYISTFDTRVINWAKNIKVKVEIDGKVKRIEYDVGEFINIVDGRRIDIYEGN